MVQERIEKGISILNQNPQTLTGPRLLHELVARHSESTPNAIDFLEHGSKRRKISYQSLHDVSDELARRIHHTLAGLKDASAVVPIFLPQSSELYTTLLAVLKAGKAFCPLSLETPEERLKFILKDLSANILVTSRSYAHQLPVIEGLSVVFVGEDSTQRYGGQPVDGTSMDTENLAYVLYTSGSTGLPKAVKVSHRAVTQSLLAHERHIPSFSRFLQFAAPTFDVSIFEIFFTWFRRKTLVGCTRERMVDNLPSTIEELKVDAVELTPTVAGSLLGGRKSVPGLRLLLTIGEMLTRHVIDEFGGDNPKTSILWGMYGPTEAAIHCTLQPRFHSGYPVGNIGIPLDTVLASIFAPLSRESNTIAAIPLPIGDVGELVIGGPQVADGYLNRTELTTNAFFEHPHYGYLYRTGDKARILPNGTIECLGRLVSGQVKIRGQRVELGEVEETIAKLDDCRSVITTIIEENLVAFCAANPRCVMKEDVFAICQRWLPRHMIPADVVIIPQMPHLASGKIDRKALAAKYIEARSATLQAQPSLMDNKSKQIFGIIGSILDRDIWPGSALRSAGLDSLRAIRLASQLRDEGYTLGAVDVLAAVTVNDLIAACVAESENVAFETLNHTDVCEVADIQCPELERHRGSIFDVISCTPIQDGMLSETMINSDAYCNWIELELQAPRAFSDICAVLQTLAMENEILRSGFITRTGAHSSSFLQVVWKSLSPGQFVEVTSFSRSYTLGSTDSLLRPFHIQINSTLPKPRLLIQLHHALYDGWSVDLLIENLEETLSGKSLGHRPQYRDVVSYLSRTSNADSLAYWTDRLTDYSRTQLPNFNGKIVKGDRCKSVRSSSLVDIHSLSVQAKELECHPQVFFQAAAAYLIGSYLGSTDIVIGTVTSGRTIPVAGIERIMGPCLSSLPLRVDFTQYSTIEELLNGVQSSNRSMLRHCTVPLRDIVRGCGLEPGTHLFDVLLVWQESLPSQQAKKTGVTIVDSADNLDYKLTLEFEPCEHSVNYKVTYDATIIPKQQVTYLCNQIDDLVRFFVQHPRAKLQEAKRCFSPRHLSVANPVPITKHFRNGPAHAVERWAAQAPDKEALVLGHLDDNIMSVAETLTYDSLNKRANKLARALLKHNIREDEIICVILDKSINLYVSILAVLKLGSGYLPIVPDTPPDRTRTILQQAKIRLCITDRRASEPIRRQTQITFVDIDNTNLSSFPDDNLHIPYRGSHLAYAVFTSGSTGTPKGVLVTQDNLMSNLALLYDLYPTDSDSKLLQACSQAFDVSVFEIFFAWYAGMALCSATKDDLFNDLEGSINRLGVTHLSLTPTVASLVNPSHVPKVKFLITAGEAVNEHVRRQWAGKGLYQGYGPSETTNICTVRAPVTTDDLINNIGSPFSNTSALVLDPDSKDILPRGAVGELCFGGAQVFRGYLNRPDLNKEKIIDHPEYGRIYRSGDMGLVLPDDSILFTGRSDDQVKIRGQRVELGEITSTILDCDSVADCLTLHFAQDAPQRLVSFWVPKGLPVSLFEPLQAQNFSTIISTIFEVLSQKLPSYMIPTHAIPISRIPFTAQTKTDKRLLQNTFGGLTTEYLEAVSSKDDGIKDASQLTEQERKIAEAVARVVRVPLSEVRRTSSFYNLGLDSVSAIRLATSLRQDGFIDTPVSAILKNPTVARLSLYYSSHSDSRSLQDGSNVETQHSLQQESTSHIRSMFQDRGFQVQKILPCTPLQDAMLSGTPSTTESSYCNTMIFSVIGHLVRLHDCWDEMFKRHEILRTAFVPTDDPNFAFAQVVVGYEKPEWDELASDDDLEVYAQKRVPELLERYQPPVRLATIGPGETTKLVFCCHHAMYDGTAISVLLREVQEVYWGHELLPPITYETYLRHILTQNLDAADHFWRSSLAKFEPTFFPSLTSKTMKDPGPSSTLTYTLKTSLSKALDASHKMSTSLLPIIQATWAKLLYFYLGEEDVCFGNVVSGRAVSEQGIERLVAPCFNTVPVRVDFDYGGSNADLVQYLHRFSIDCLPFHSTSLRRIQSKARPEGGRLFDTLVILQQPSQPLDNEIWMLEKDIGQMDLPLVCEVSQDAQKDHLSLTLHYATSILSAEDAIIVAKTFDAALSSCIQFPRSSARDTIAFPSQLLAESNLDHAILEPRYGEYLHSAFQHNATVHPEVVALDFQRSNGERIAWTFRDLNETANKIAHALIGLQVGVEDIIPIHISKSPHFYASILGVLKAGAAFTPLHPDLPVARKQFMLSELHPKVVLCSAVASLDWSDALSVLDVSALCNYPKHNPSIMHLRSSNLAYCLYTSGSTGLPKAVAVEHRSPIQTIESSRSLIPWDHNSRLLQYAAVTFDMCYYDCFLVWTFGFTLCAAEQDVMLDNLASSIRSLDVDLLDLTPSVAASISRSEVPNVKWLYCIGEAMTPEIVGKWEGACVNSYGPTEAAFCTTMFPVGSSTKSSIIGTPFSSSSFAVFSKNGNRTLPIFGLGELYIGGAQLARGYLSQNDLTEEKFVQRNGKRYYRTGDNVRMLGDGNFEFIGRADDQVKIRGLRVELGEINYVLQNCDKRIASVTTQIMRKSSESKDQLIAFLAIRKDADRENLLELKGKAKKIAVDTLPPYMVPQFYFTVPKIPQSISGKIDKKALLETFRNAGDDAPSSGRSLETALAHNWTESEAQIRDILAKLSQTSINDILPTTSIYQLGLDSISAVQVAAMLRKKGFDTSAVDVLKHPSCLELATCIDTQGKSISNDILSFDFDSFDKKVRGEMLQDYNIAPKNIESIRPCTPVQRGMLSQFIAADGAVYFNYLCLRLQPDIDVQKLKEAWTIVTKRHIMLRTGFVSVNDPLFAFAMVNYTPEASSLPWEEQKNGLTRHVEDWVRGIRNDALRQLHRPPWGLRLTRESGERFLDLAIFHALFDAHSLQTFFDDVALAYNGTSFGDLTPSEPMLATIISSSSDESKSRTAFWKELGGGAVPTKFPNLTPLRLEPAPSSILTKSCTRSLADLEDGCKVAGITLQAAGIAAWASILAAYTGENPVTCGVVLSGRNIEVAEGVALPCIVTLPVVCRVRGNRQENAIEVMKTTAGIQEHQFTPLSKAQRWMGYPDEPLFDTIFAFQKLRNTDRGPTLWTVADERATIDYPISIELEPKGDWLDLRLTYLPHIVPKQQASLVLDQLDRLLEDVVFGNAGPGTVNPALYSITPPKERTIPSKARLLHEMVEQSASKHPDTVALEFAHSMHDGRYESTTWTYAELDTEGNRVANLIVSLGVQTGSLVAVCFDKCPEASFAMLGILKAGCAFVALDQGAPRARKEFILKDSGAKLLLSMRRYSSDLAGIPNVQVLNLDEGDTKDMPTTKPMLSRAISPQDCSYCLYTSGTTGTPKGCELTHENAVQALMSFCRLFAGHWNETSRWLQFASFHFDVSVLEQYWSWLVGICVVSAPRDLIFEDLAASIQTLGITHIDLTPSLARIVHPDDVTSLCKGVFITGGESLKQEILDVWGPKGVIYNGYGPTEATIGCTMYPRVPLDGKPSNIGPQFDNVGSFVLQPGTDEPVLRGGVGELCVSGKLVGKGYLNRPDLTSERFPFLRRFGERVYRTGDLVRILHDGSFEFLGRADDQVKLRGQRLEIGEINSVIKQSGRDIADLATLVLKHSKQQKDQLVSFIVLGSKHRGSPEAILKESHGVRRARQACHDKLPGYMVPTHFVTLTAMPLNVNNKADARRLKELYNELSVSDLQLLSGFEHEENVQWSFDEEQIRETLSNTLHISKDEINRTSSFFELGLDSISAIGFTRALRLAGISKVTASAVMKNSSIGRLSKHLSTLKNESDDRGSVIEAQQAITAIQHRHRRAVAEALCQDVREVEFLLPCTPLQQGMIARFLDSDDGLYFNTFHFQLGDQIDMERLQDAWYHAYRAISTLRTAFADTVDGYMQAIRRKGLFPWELSTVSKDDSVDAHLNDLRRQWWQKNRTIIKRPFELILVSSPSSKILAVHVFHALYDGISIELLFNFVWDNYRGRKDANAGPSFHSVLAYGPLQPRHDAQEFWRKVLADNHFKALQENTEIVDESSVTVTRRLQLPGYENIRRGLNVTPQAIAQACWVSALHRHIKGAVIIGMVVSGRSIDFKDAEQVIGPMFNTLPYYYRPKPRESWPSIIKRAHEFNIAAQSYQHTSLRDIMKWCKRGPHQPLFDTLFVYQVGSENRDWAENDAWTLLEGGSQADYPLAIEVEQMGTETFRLTLVAQGRIMDQESSEQLLNNFEKSLKDALNNHEAIVESPYTVEEDMNEDSNGSVNVFASVDLDDSAGFEWSKNALMLREEIAGLADTDLQSIDGRTSIFELGLDSIDAIKLSSKLKSRGLTLSVSNIMRNLTIARMVPKISSSAPSWAQGPSSMIFNSHRRRLRNWLDRRGLLTDDIEEVFPLTPLQEGMVAEMRASRYERYYNHDVLKLAPDSDTQRLQAAWKKVVESSPILRTSFIQIDDTSVDFAFAQVVHCSTPGFWKEIAFSGEPNFSTLMGDIRREVLQQQQLTPTFYVHLIKSGSDRYLILSIPHALYDGWSLGLVHNDVHQAYVNEFAPRPSYDLVLRDILSATGADAVAFWRDHLTDATPTIFERRPSVSHPTVYRKESVSSVMLSEITSFAKENNVTLQALGQLAYALTLASYVNSLDVTFGSVLSGRDDDKLAEVLFPTMNTVAIRMVLHGTRREMLQYVQENFSQIKQWQHFPLRRAQSLAGVQDVLFESLFIYQKKVVEARSDGGKLYESIEGHSDVEFPVCVEIEVMEDQLLWRCAVKEEVFDETGVEGLMNRLDQALRNIIQDPEAPTIRFNSDGTTSICRLPAFRDRKDDTSADSNSDDRPTATSTLQTAKTIREVLAFVSKTPEEEITGNLTIFHIGLDSISAIKVSSLLRKRNIVLSVGEMLKAGTVEKMARLVDERASTPAEEVNNTQTVLSEVLKDIDLLVLFQRNGVDEADVERALSATAGQAYMLSMWLNSQGSSFYPEFHYQLSGSMSFDTLEESWKALVSANPILKTICMATYDKNIPYIQVVLRETQSRILKADGNDKHGNTARTQSQPMVCLYASKTDRGWDLKLKIHHALYDGVSLPILMQQLQGLCNGSNAPTNRDAFSMFLASTLTAPITRERRSFWTKYLDGLNQQMLPQPKTTSRFRVEIFRPQLLAVKALESLSRKQGLTRQSIFLAVYAKLYAAFTSTFKDDDVVMGIYLANRSHPISNIENAAIPTVNLVPLRVSKPLDQDLLDVAAQVQDDILEISTPTNSSVRLYEIDQWTGIKIDTFVNFLRLPDTGKQPAADKQGIKITSVGEWNEEVSRVTQMETESFAPPEGLVHDEVNASYLHAVDVEATIRNGALDVGIFAPEEMLGLEAAEKMVADISHELEGLMEDDRDEGV
ncbi:hypothetical protein BDV96DRAFT_492707 [Lophiotrema nucula]|uniref:Carrier domain-containing protein n=1 Tax=Lophiotrema nucula TaxID=690887 RepID=A0A6A5ZAH5_9PLEO|nr:hypothetical protein BDV96DRAFT_492707 [Lophiotrema nucula]